MKHSRRTLIGALLPGLLLSLSLAACAAGQSSPQPSTVAVEAAADPVPHPGSKSQPGTVDYSCTTDADCRIKDVGNCCGHYPACVNADSPTFPEQVKADCAARGLSGICGFPELSGCQCIAGRCEGISGPRLETGEIR